MKIHLNCKWTLGTISTRSSTYYDQFHHTNNKSNPAISQKQLQKILQNYDRWETTARGTWLESNKQVSFTQNFDDLIYVLPALSQITLYFTTQSERIFVLEPTGHHNRLWALVFKFHHQLGNLSIIVQAGSCH